MKIKSIDPIETPVRIQVDASEDQEYNDLVKNTYISHVIRTEESEDVNNVLVAVVQESQVGFYGAYLDEDKNEMISLNDADDADLTEFMKNNRIEFKHLQQSINERDSLIEEAEYEEQ